MGIEPTWPAWKAGTLPLSYARKPLHQNDFELNLSTQTDSTPTHAFKWGKQDSNLRRQSHQIYSLAHLTTLEFPRVLNACFQPFSTLFVSRGAPESPRHQPCPVELAAGLEPATSGLQNRSSAIELR